MDRVAFSIFGIDIMWYGIIIALGITLGTVVAMRELKKRGYDPDIMVDLMLFAVPAALICARIYYVVFSWDMYKDNPIEVFNIRQGGLAIHGGLIGAIATAAIFCRVRKIDFWKLADIAAPSIALGQAIGRWGNYVNQEAHGGPTDLPWGIMIDGEKVHPTFLYESIWNVALFFFLVSYRKKRAKFDGEVLFLYLGLYSLGRFFIEGLRTDSLMIGPLRVAQLISLAIMAVCAAVILIKRKNRKQRNGE